MRVFFIGIIILVLCHALLAAPAPAAYPDGQIAAGGSHSLIIRDNNTVLAFGDNSNGQCVVPHGLDNYVRSVAAGEDHSLALLDDGTVIAWGANDHWQAAVPFNLEKVTAIAAGANHNIVLLEMVL